MRFVDLSMHISFSGVLTFKKSEAVRQAAALVPAERLLVETVRLDSARAKRGKQMNSLCSAMWRMSGSGTRHESGRAS